MSTTSAQDDLKRVIADGVYEEYKGFILAQAILLSTVTYAGELNDRGFGELFGLIQQHCRNALILALTKMFDPTHRNNRPRSIPEALRILSERKQDVHFVNDGTLVLHRYGLDSSMGKDALIDALVARTHARIAQVQGALDDVKMLRDKYFAHRDRNVQVEALPQKTLGEITTVAEVAEEFLDLAGVFLFNADWFELNRYHSNIKAHDAYRVMDSFERLMATAHIQR